MVQKAAFLANRYIGPWKLVGHSQDLTSDNLAHGWHWIQDTNEGWSAYPLVPGKAQHCSDPSASARPCQIHGFEIYEHPEFNTKFAVIAQKASPPPDGN